MSVARAAFGYSVFVRVRCGNRRLGFTGFRKLERLHGPKPWHESFERRTIIATKTKRTLLSRVVVAVVVFLCPLFLYQNAAVLYLNVDVAIFCTKEVAGPTKKKSR